MIKICLTGGPCGGKLSQVLGVSKSSKPSKIKGFKTFKRKIKI